MADKPKANDGSVEARFPVGSTFRWRKKKCHVRGYVDGFLVFRWWGKHKQRWFYEVEPEWLVRDFAE
jgi:hypothetical protein